MKEDDILCTLTRARRWARFLGLGKCLDSAIKEINDLRDREFNLRYAIKEQRARAIELSKEMMK